MFEKVLVVDDDVDSRSKFYDMLSSLGYRVTSVPLAQEAFIKLKEERPDLVVLDEKMPELGGIEAAKKIREFDKELGIILLTENEVTEQNKQDVKGLNIYGIVKKDFSSHFMMKNILEFLKEKEASKKREPLAEQTKGLILVVDDNPEIEEVLTIFLTKKGFKVLSANSGESALHKIEVSTEKPRVVFLDIRMPGMDGIMALKKIKEIDESIKVIMLTAVQEEHIAREARDSGASDYLVKPCNFQKLEALLLSLFS